LVTTGTSSRAAPRARRIIPLNAMRSATRSAAGARHHDARSTAPVRHASGVAPALRELSLTDGLALYDALLEAARSGDAEPDEQAAMYDAAISAALEPGDDALIRVRRGRDRATIPRK
jgi:hypothetical protein